jgi:hypothetical protein
MNYAKSVPRARPRGQEGGKAVNPSDYEERGEAMREEFRAFLILLLDILERGETARAIAKIREILDK